jgi:alpha-galactosidase
MKKITFKLAFISCFVALSATAQKFEGLARTPPMGWNSWNKFACRVDENIIKTAADAMVASGMKAAGYEYIVIDDCWQTGRDSLGFVIADPEHFPSGIKALADYIHSKGLKFGIYSCAGKMTCQLRPGSRGYEFQDALMYSKWGVDYLKLDWCHSEGQNPKESYELMRDALYKSGRPVVLSMCEWGLSKPWEWAQNVAHLWRTTGDIQNNWDIPDAKKGKCWAGGVVINLDMQQDLESFAGPGHWNDPDMLEVGNEGLTPEEERAHFSLWCMLAAPLMAGNDLIKMNAVTKALLTNKDAIAIDQDPLGMQGYKIKDYGEFEIFYKPLQNGDVAICLFNRYDGELEINMNWQTFATSLSYKGKSVTSNPTIDKKDVMLPKAFEARDIWNKKTIASDKNFIAKIARHDVLLFRLIKKQ